MDKSTKQTPELIPAYERPVDKGSIDSRMNAHLDWEAGKRTAPRTADTIEAPASTKANKSGNANKPKRILALGAAVVGLAVTPNLIGKAMDHEHDTGLPLTEPVPGQVVDSAQNSESNLVKVFPQQVSK